MKYRRLFLFPFDNAKLGIGFRGVRRAGLFVGEFIQAKKPVRSTGKSGLVEAFLAV